MSKFHAWYYDPKTGEGRIFDDPADVPEGWVDRVPEPGSEAPAPAKAAKAAAPAAASPAKAGAEPKGMTRTEIMAALKGGGVEFKATSKTEELHDLLKGKVMEVLAQRNIEFDADADVRDLLAKLG